MIICFSKVFLLVSLCHHPVDREFAIGFTSKCFQIDHLGSGQYFFLHGYCLFLFNLGAKFVLLDWFIIGGTAFVSMSVTKDIVSSTEPKYVILHPISDKSLNS